MAYVAISDKLLNSTENNIRKMCDKEKSTHPAPPESITVPDGDANMTAMIWGNHQHLSNMMPDEWKHNPGRLVLRVKYKESDAPEARDRAVDLQVTAPSGFECPYTKDSNHSYYGPMFTVESDNLLLPQAARDLVAHRKVTAEIDARWTDVRSKVRAFLVASKSLNEALKVWPGLSLYVSQDYIDRVNNKGTPREKAQSGVEALASSMDLDTLTAAAVASKLTV